MLTKIVNTVIEKFASQSGGEAPRFEYLGYVDPYNVELGAHAVFYCDGNSYKVICFYHSREVIIEQQTYSRS
jgi:hypothetical protein